ncbi:MAG: deacetylase [Lachnospiraceae bacterium]|nr:deacetylase [Lachnospiraceae bacterium]
MKYFIITIDTEGDNLWSWSEGDKITTENTKYLQRFQNLCEQYAFKPVWLSNYEMIENKEYVKFIQRVEETNTGELGMHLHAWNTPPKFDLPVVQTGAPYLIEYPFEVMEQKIEYLTNHIYELTGLKPTTHRAGRWAMNQDYYDLLIKYGYEVDCSVTPHIDWAKSVGRSEGVGGSDYSNSPEKPHYVRSTANDGEILEVPVSIRTSHKYFMPAHITWKTIAGSLLSLARGNILWLRPNGYNLKQMKYLIREISISDDEYLMFMLHSSELMPGGSPTFRTEESIEKLYSDLEIIFDMVSKNFRGITLRDYGRNYYGN